MARVPTCRDAVLEAMSNLEVRSGKKVFRLQEIVNEVLRSTDRYPEVTIRTQISSVMCANAPVHHANHTNDLERVGHGLYMRREPPESPDPAVADVGIMADLRPVGDERAWYWEGNVQNRFASFLLEEGWSIVSTADTSTREMGPDIQATQGHRRLFAEVKGYPTTTYARGPKVGQPKPTNPTTQARHWYAGALLSAALARDSHPDSEIAIVLPMFGTYESLIRRTRTTLDASRIVVFLMDELGACRRA